VGLARCTAVAEARDHAQIVSDTVGAGSGLWRSWTATVEALCAIENEDLDLARRALMLVSKESLISPMARAKLAYARGRVLLAAGDAEGAHAEFLLAGKETAEVELPDSPDVPWRPWGAIAAAARGAHDEARELATVDLASARAVGAPNVLGTSLLAAAATERGDARVTLLDEAVHIFARSSSRLDVARGHVELGLALLESGHRERATQALRNGLGGADLCGSRALAGAARRGLRALGHRPRRTAQSGIGALTRTERAVARLAATGATTRKIAASMTVSPRTIEWHLQTVYRKLGLSGRADLVPLAGELSDVDTLD
jgi:DNA-binding CsgD family transcriptional regulator